LSKFVPSKFQSVRVTLAEQINYYIKNDKWELANQKAFAD